MCFAPQRRALFCHHNLNFQKWSEAGVFCTFWLPHVLRATTACNFSSLIWPDGSAPAALPSLLFDPPEPQIIGKTQCFATFLPFRAPASSFFWFSFSDLLSSDLSLSSLLFSSFLLWLFPPLLFHLSILSEVSLLNFLASNSKVPCAWRANHFMMGKSTFHLLNPRIAKGNIPFYLPKSKTIWQISPSYFRELLKLNTYIYVLYMSVFMLLFSPYKTAYNHIKPVNHHVKPGFPVPFSTSETR